MHRDKWQRIEQLLDFYRIKPIVAIIPNNQDVSLQYSELDSDFWDIIHRWNNKGWSIAMHGCTHKYCTKCSGLVPINCRSEFAGLAEKEQQKKIRASWHIFTKQCIYPKIWIAPAHSFDLNTISALLLETPIRIISDGIAYDTFHAYGMYWIPVQLRNYIPLPFGTYTICMHPNELSEARIAKLEHALKKYRHTFVNPEDIRLKMRKRNLLDFAFEKMFYCLLELARLLQITKK